MRIAIEAWPAADVPAGRGRYVRELLRAMAALKTGHEFTLLTRRPWEDLGDGMAWKCVSGAGPAWAVKAAVRETSGHDVVLATASYALPALSRTPAAAVVYDLVAFDRELGAPRGAALERLTLPLAVRRSRALLCISSATRDELVRRFPRAAATARVTPLAPGEEFRTPRGDPAVLERLGIGGPFVLSAATLEPRKNLPRLISAFASLPPEVRGEHELILTGARGWRTQAIDEALAGSADRVRAVGFVSDEDLATLYATATAVAYPSLAEGFGLPVAEAMAAGAPVLTSDRSSLAEVGGDAVVQVDPTDEQAIAAALACLLTDEPLRARLAAAGPERAARFTWEATARATLRALEEVAAG